MRLAASLALMAGMLTAGQAGAVHDEASQPLLLWMGETRVVSEGLALAIAEHAARDPTWPLGLPRTVEGCLNTGWCFEGGLYSALISGAVYLKENEEGVALRTVNQFEADPGPALQELIETHSPM